MDTPIIQRQVAYKVWIKQINGGTFAKPGGFNPSYVTIDEKNVSRVNILATVVGKFVSEDGNYGAFTLDDGSDTIRAKAFGPEVRFIKKAQSGDIIRLVGKVKEYNEEKYLAPEVVRIIKDPNWITVWQLELGKVEPARTEEKEEGVKQETLPAPVVEKVNNSAKITAIIRELSGETGALMSKVIEQSGLGEEEAKNVIGELLANGDVFEPKKGRLKVLD